MLVVGVIVLILGYVLVQVLLQVLANKKPGLKELTVGFADIILGRILYEIACINMTFDRYTWIGDLTGHEIFYYVLRYGGLLTMMLGIATTLVCFYTKIKGMPAEDEDSNSTASSGKQEKISAWKQEKIPAWKQVEMDEMEKNNQN